MSKLPLPIPLFDTLQYLNKLSLPETLTMDPDLNFINKDFRVSIEFLKQYDGNLATFNSYRKEIERLTEWSWLIQKKSILDLRRSDIEEYLNFCKNPPLSWIGTKKVSHFVSRPTEKLAATVEKRSPNPEWRPFVVTLSKIANKRGDDLNPKTYILSDKAFKEIFAVLSSFYNFLLQEDYAACNPITQIRQKSKFIRRYQSTPVVRRLSELQWSFVIETAQIMAANDPINHERTLFIMTALYTMYLRISELVAANRWAPTMHCFNQDNDNNWWFKVIGKGNKERQIAVSNAMLTTLKRWRTHLGLTPLPTTNDQTPLIPKTRGKGPITSTNQIRNVVQLCFDNTVIRMQQQNLAEEATSLQTATVHWLRHTGISDDVKHRPREHVRDDAGHSSGSTTDRYIDVELRERNLSAKNKPISNLN